MRHFAPDVARRLVLAQPLIDDLPQQVLFGLGQKLDLGDDLGSHPMHAAKDQGRSEAAAARRGAWCWFLAAAAAAIAVPSSALFDAGAAGIDQPSSWIVIAETSSAIKVWIWH